MSQDKDEIRRRLEAMHEPAPRAEPADLAPPARPERPARPSRPAVPVPALPKPSPAAPTVVVSPQAPLLTAGRVRMSQPSTQGTPAVAAPPPDALPPKVARVSSDRADAIAADRARKRVALAQTLLPSCLVLGVTLPLLGAGWFCLDRFSMLRDNSLGIALPIALFVFGVVFVAVAGLVFTQARSTVRV